MTCFPPTDRQQTWCHRHPLEESSSLPFPMTSINLGWSYQQQSGICAYWTTAQPRWCSWGYLSRCVKMSVFFLHECKCGEDAERECMEQSEQMDTLKPGSMYTEWCTLGTIWLLGCHKLKAQNDEIYLVQPQSDQTHHLFMVWNQDKMHYQFVCVNGERMYQPLHLILLFEVVHLLWKGHIRDPSISWHAHCGGCTCTYGCWYLLPWLLLLFPARHWVVSAVGCIMAKLLQW